MPQPTATRPDAQNAVRRYHGGDLNGKRLEAMATGMLGLGWASDDFVSKLNYCTGA